MHTQCQLPVQLGMHRRCCAASAQYQAMINLLIALLRTIAKPAEVPKPALSEHKEFLDYAERESRRTLDDLRSAFNGHFERAIKVLTLLIGGAGAVAAYTINNWDRLDAPGQWALLVLVTGWSGVAIYLATYGMRSRRIGAGPMVTAIAGTYMEHAGSPMQPQSKETAASALQIVRMAELNREHLQIQAYAHAVTSQTKDVRLAVGLAALSPALALGLWTWAMHCLSGCSLS